MMQNMMNYDHFTAVIMGKSGSGKDTAGKLLEKKGYERIVTHTSRPMRTGEQEGVTYHYHTQEEFEQLRSEGYFAESRNYDAAFGHCSYGTSKESLTASGRKYIIVTPEGYESLKRAGIEGMIPVYLRTQPEELKRRLSGRLQNEADPEKKKVLTEEIDRRLEADRHDFVDVEAAAAGISSGGYEDLITIDTDALEPDEVMSEIDTSIQAFLGNRLKNEKLAENQYLCYLKDGYDTEDLRRENRTVMIALYVKDGMTAALQYLNGSVTASVYPAGEVRADTNVIQEGSDRPLYMTKTSAAHMEPSDIRAFLSDCIDRYREISLSRKSQVHYRDEDGIEL